MNTMDLFQILNDSSKLIKAKLDLPYLEALIHSAENLIDQGTIYNEGDNLTAETVKELEHLYADVNLEEFEPESIRKAMQIALLTGMKEDYVQPNHQMTPDSLGTLIAYLIEIIAEPAQKIHIADLSVGTGNLILTVNHFLKKEAEREIVLSGVDNDDLMLSLASTNSTIQRTPINLLYQDALTNLFIQPADIMVSDLPIGYYPVTEKLDKFETHFEQGYSYSHYLLIEQALNYLVANGFAFFLLPNNSFNDENIATLVDYLHDVAYIQGIVQLPREIFANEESQKSILIVQKQGDKATQMGEVLMINAPDFKDYEGMTQFLGEINKWKKENL